VTPHVTPYLNTQEADNKKRNPNQNPCQRIGIFLLAHPVSAFTTRQKMCQQAASSFEM